MTSKRRFYLITLLLLFPFSIFAQKSTEVFATYNDTTVLKMDIYEPTVHNDSHQPCILFVFGGGFAIGSRDSKYHTKYFEYLNEKGFKVISIDYRLGLKNVSKAPSVFNRKPLINAINMAVEDLFKATNYILENADRLDIDTSKIILSGSSAGAITVLQADYEKRNRMKSAHLLPQNFNYAGIISFAGAIYSTKGKPKYATPTAPFLFFHGDKDDFVPYNKISFLGMGIYGPKSITSTFKKNHQPYCFYTFEDIRHDVATFPMFEFLEEIDEFISRFIIDKQPLYIDVNIKNDNRKNSKLSFSQLYKNKNK